jgi:hypothetical protein
MGLGAPVGTLYQHPCHTSSLQHKKSPATPKNSRVSLTGLALEATIFA